MFVFILIVCEHVIALYFLLFVVVFLCPEELWQNRILLPCVQCYGENNKN